MWRYNHLRSIAMENVKTVENIETSDLMVMPWRFTDMKYPLLVQFVNKFKF